MTITGLIILVISWLILVVSGYVQLHKVNKYVKDENKNIFAGILVLAASTAVAGAATALTLLLTFANAGLL